MPKKILVTYASRLDATTGVAQAIGKTFAESGAQVDVLPMKEVKELESYQAVVAGSAVRAAAWLPEALEFIQTNQKTLAKKPFAAFLVCMTLAMPNGEAYRSHVSSWLDPVRKLVRPVEEGLFAGTLDISRVESFAERVKFRLSVLFGVWKEGDHRDWNAIHAWAQKVYPLLGG
ncbi:MAG: flavodoxin domain-containing protein [Anaerolineales bacterium]|nr:flavodoxin domain-containing protein [Anaerolineales bacterium]